MGENETVEQKNKDEGERRETGSPVRQERERDALEEREKKNEKKAESGRKNGAKGRGKHQEHPGGEDG